MTSSSSLKFSRQIEHVRSTLNAMFAYGIDYILATNLSRFWPYSLCSTIDCMIKIIIDSKPRYQITPITFRQKAITRKKVLSSWEGTLKPLPYSIRMTIFTPKIAPMPKSLKVSDHSLTNWGSLTMTKFKKEATIQCIENKLNMTSTCLRSGSLS